MTIKKIELENKDRVVKWDIVKLKNGTYELARITEGQERKPFNVYTSITQAKDTLENIENALIKQGFART